MKGTVSVKVFWKMLQWIQAVCFKLMMKGPISHHLFIKMCHKNISLKPNKIFSLYLPPSPLFHDNIKGAQTLPENSTLSSLQLTTPYYITQTNQFQQIHSNTSAILL